MPVDAGIVSFTADRLAEGDRLRYDDFVLIFKEQESKENAK